MNKHDYIPPVEEVKDKLHRLIRSALIVAPSIMGVPPQFGVLSTVLLDNYNLLWKPSAEGRYERWVEDVIGSINLLTERIDNIEERLVSEEFQSLLITANQLVLKHHQVEKIKFFSNAVVNSLTTPSLSYDKKITFINLLDELTVSHIKILKFFRNGIIWGIDKETIESRYPYYVAKELFKLDPDLVSEQLFVEKIIQDLFLHNLYFEYLLIRPKVGDVVISGKITNTDAGTIGLSIPVSDLPNKKIVFKSSLNGFGLGFLNYVSELNLENKS